VSKLYSYQLESLTWMTVHFLAPLWPYQHTPLGREILIGRGGGYRLKCSGNRGSRESRHVLGSGPPYRLPREHWHSCMFLIQRLPPLPLPHRSLGWAYAQVFHDALVVLTLSRFT
jgi:hypothetical protein